MFRAACDLHDRAAELASRQGEALNEVLTRALEVYVAGGLRRGAPDITPDITLEPASTPDITPGPDITPVEVLAPPDVISPPDAAARPRRQRREKAVTVPAASPWAAVRREDCPHRGLRGAYCKLCRATVC